MAEGLSAVLRQEGPIPLDAELSCAPGEVLALVGPSGSGKSTILRCLAGLATPRHGRIVCGGQTWLDTTAGITLAPGARRVGMVFQNYALFPHLTALENVLEAMDEPTAPDARARGRALLAKVHLAGLEDRRPRQLSGGQQQRVALARALAREPRALLLDEPFSAVDRATRERLYGELAELRRELAMPVVLVTHDLDEAMILADRMTLLFHGRSLQSGPPLEVVQRPASITAARLLGVENRFRARVVEHRPNEGHTLLAWNGRGLAAPLQPRFEPGREVVCIIPATGVLLMPAREAGAAVATSALQGRVQSLLRLTDRVKLRVRLEGDEPHLLHTVVPRHLAERLELAPGVALSLRLREEQIQLVPAEEGIGDEGTK